MSHDPDEDNRRSVPEFSFILGRVHGRLGGPARTIAGYLLGLRELNFTYRLYGEGRTSDLADSFPDLPKHTTQALTKSPGREFWEIDRICSDRARVVVIVGVWHRPFFFATLSLLRQRLLRRTSARVLLIPTMSLTHYDWAKHRLVKLFLRPLVRLLINQLHGVVFASTGEAISSTPRSWRRDAVILHPSESANQDSTALAAHSPAPLDALFVGRIDDQKDLPLLLRAMALTDGGVHLHVLGDGPHSTVSNLKDLTQRLGIKDRVHWVGWRPHSEVQSWIKGARVVVVTSKIENYCHVAAEAILASTELVLVDRVLSAADFSRVAPVQVIPPTNQAVADAIKRALDRSVSSSAARQAGARRSVRLALLPRLQRHYIDLRWSSQGLRLPALGARPFVSRPTARLGQRSVSFSNPPASNGYANANPV